jgi:hypothetical protein
MTQHNQLTAPDHVVVGSQKERNDQVKEFWIKQLGAQCVNCEEAYKKVQIKQSFQSRTSKRGKRSNLKVHYTGSHRKGHKPFQLGKLQVPSDKDFKKQNSYLKEFIFHLCPCELRCKPCHGSLHGKESGKCMHVRYACKCFNSFDADGLHS